MRTMILIAMMTAGCVTGGERAEGQAVTSPGPTVTVTPRSTGELAVSWTSLSVASYSVLRGVGGGAPAIVATVGAPTTSYIDSDLVAGSTYCYQVVGVFEGGATTAPSAQACPPASAPLPAVTYVTVPSTFFSTADIHTGVNGQVYQLPVAAGTRIASVSITAQCSSAGFIIACVRVRERGTWDWCSQPVACSGPASAVAPLASPVAVTASQHVDIALMSGPTVASSPFGVYTTL